MCPDGGVGCFEDDGHVVETGVSHEAREELFADTAVAQSLMTVDVASAVFFAVVEVDGSEVLESDFVLKLVEGEVVAHLGAQIVAGGEGVTCVDAHSYAALVVDAADDTGYLAEFEAEVGSLSGSVLDNGCDAFGLGEGFVDFCGYLVEALLLANLVEVTARVEVEQR